MQAIDFWFPDLGADAAPVAELPELSDDEIRQLWEAEF